MVATKSCKSPTATGYRVAVIDQVLWRAAVLGII